MSPPPPRRAMFFPPSDFDSRQVLLALNPLLDPALAAPLLSALEATLLRACRAPSINAAMEHSQQLQYLATTGAADDPEAEKLKTNLKKALAAVLEGERTYFSGALDYNPCYLLFEYVSGFLLRPQQVCLFAPRPLADGALQGFFRIIKNQGGGPSPKTPSPPPQTKVTIVGKNEIYNRENLVRPFLVHQVLGPKPPPPLPPPCSKEALALAQ